MYVLITMNNILGMLSEMHINETSIYLRLQFKAEITSAKALHCTVN